LRFKFTKHDDQFLLMYPKQEDSYSLEIVKAELRIYKAVLDTNKLLAMEMVMRQKPAVIPLQRTQMTYHIIPASVTDYGFPNLCLGTLPTRMLFAFVTNKAYNGVGFLHPFNFQHFRLNEVRVSVNGQPALESPLRMDYIHHQYNDGYHSFLNTTRCYKRDISRPITLHGYIGGNAIYGMDFSNDLRSSSGIVYAPLQTGTLSMDLRWQRPVTEPIVMICQFFFDSQLNINSDRSLEFDYSA